MFTSHVKYEGELRTTATHLRSGSTITTDAPVDNHGRGEAFSPTDTVATALATCMFSIMGIAAKTHNINLQGAEADVLKVMADNPRRIAEIRVKFHFPLQYSDKEKKILETAALNCPVAKSLHPEIRQMVEFGW